MKQFNLEQKVFADLLVEQTKKTVDIDIVIKQIIDGKSTDVVIKTQNAITVPVFSTHGEGWVFVPEEQVDEVSASITGGGTVWLDGDTIKCSGARPSPAHDWDDKQHAWVLNKNKQAELDTQAQLQAVHEAVAAVKEALQARIDQEAQGRGFSNGNSLMLYAGFDNPFKPLAQEFGVWEAGVWYEADQYMEKVKAGKAEVLSPEQAVARIPIFVMPEIK